jgi:hypothetical protein
MKAVTFALLPDRVGCNLGLITDNLGEGLLVVWCEEPMLEGMIVRRGDGSLTDEIFDSVARVTR